MMKDARHPRTDDENELIAIIQDLKEMAQSHAIVVEGMKDVESLRNLGIEGDVVQLNIGKPLLEFCTTMFEGYEGVVILTDWDDKGNTLCRIIKQHLKSCDIPFDTRLRSRLAAVLKNDVKDVQGIYKFLLRNNPDILDMIIGAMNDLKEELERIEIVLDREEGGK